MKRARDLVMVVAIVMLGGGYVLSQWAAYNGTVSVIAAKFDQAPIRMLAALLFVATLILAFWPDSKEPS